MRIFASERLSEHKYKTPEGYLICVDAILARTGKQEYTRDEIFHDGLDEIVEVDRKPEEVFSAKTLASFENKPITVEHPDVDVNSRNYKDYAVGFVRDVKRGKTKDGQDVILGNLVITDADTIAEIEDGQHTNLSCGYDCDINDSSNPQQKNIRGNHVALCEVPRAGITKIVDAKSKEWYNYLEDSYITDVAIEKGYWYGRSISTYRYDLIYIKYISNDRVVYDRYKIDNGNIIKTEKSEDIKFIKGDYDHRFNSYDEAMKWFKRVNNIQDSIRDDFYTYHKYKEGGYYGYEDWKRNTRIGIHIVVLKGASRTDKYMRYFEYIPSSSGGYHTKHYEGNFEAFLYNMESNDFKTQIFSNENDLLRWLKEPVKDSTDIDYGGYEVDHWYGETYFGRPNIIKIVRFDRGTVYCNLYTLEDKPKKIKLRSTFNHTVPIGSIKKYYNVSFNNSNEAFDWLDKQSEIKYGKKFSMDSITFNKMINLVKLINKHTKLNDMPENESLTEETRTKVNWGPIHNAKLRKYKALIEKYIDFVKSNKIDTLSGLEEQIVYEYNSLKRDYDIDISEQKISIDKIKEHYMTKVDKCTAKFNNYSKGRKLEILVR